MSIDMSPNWNHIFTNKAVGKDGQEEKTLKDYT